MNEETAKPTILFLVGMSGAGKSTCVEHLETKDIPSVYFGGIVVEETKRRHDGETSEAWEKIVREEFRAKDGMAAIALRIIPKIEKLLNTHDKVVADGLYSWSEYKILKEHFGNKCLIVAITAPRKTRHERLAHRPIRPLTEAQVTAREYAEIENIEKGGPIANADYTVNNDKDPLEMIAELDRILLEAGFLETEHQN
jgi:dephospho-CoA kinase